VLMTAYIRYSPVWVNPKETPPLFFLVLHTNVLHGKNSDIFFEWTVFSRVGCFLQKYFIWLLLFAEYCFAEYCFFQMPPRGIV